MAEAVGILTGVLSGKQTPVYTPPSLSGFLEPTVSIDNWGFRFFYSYTTALLVTFSAATAARQFFGNPIECDAGSARGAVDQGALESYCWMYSTWDIPREYKGACSGGDLGEGRGRIVYNSYYQWVPLYLLVLSVLFYLPRLFWLLMEGGLMRFFGRGTASRLVEDEHDKRERLVRYYTRNIHNKFNIYFFAFIFCECLNLAMVILQFGMTNQFLSKRFITYGFQVWRYYLLPDEEQQMSFQKNPMCETFPRIGNDGHILWDNTIRRNIWDK